MLPSFNYIDPHTLLFIKTIGYPTMLLIMIIEGPIITLLAAFLASFGFFNVFIVLFLSITGDLIGDIILYAVGYYGGQKVLLKAERILHIKPNIIAKLENLFTKHGRKTIFAVKSTTGLCWITFIAAGTVKMNLREFLKASLLGGIVWSAFLVICGYFFGYAFEKINDYIKYAGILIFALAVIFYIAIIFYKKYQSKKIIEKDAF